MELQAFRIQGAGQSTIVAGNTFSSDDATESSGETLPRTLMDASQPLLARIEHVDSEQVSAGAIKHGLIVASQLCFRQPIQQPSTSTLPMNPPAG
jgi:hypothetical protein